MKTEKPHYTPHFLAWGCPENETHKCRPSEACAVVRIERAGVEIHLQDRLKKRASLIEIARGIDETICHVGKYFTKRGHGVTVVYANGKTRTVRAAR